MRLREADKDRIYLKSKNPDEMKAMKRGIALRKVHTDIGKLKSEIEYLQRSIGRDGYTPDVKNLYEILKHIKKASEISERWTKR